MKIISIEASIVTQWPYWIQTLMIISLSMVLVFNMISTENYRQRAMFIVGCFIGFYSIRSGFLAHDIAVGIFFGGLSTSSIIVSKMKGIDSKKLKYGFALLLLFLITVILYFNVYSQIFFQNRIYINTPFRLYFSGTTQWGLFSLVTLTYIFRALKKSNLDFNSKIRFALNTVVLFFWITFFSVSTLASGRMIGIGTNNKFDSLTKNIYYGFHVDALNKYGKPRLHQAVMDQDFKLVKKLVKAGADVNIRGRSLTGGQAPIMFAVNRNYEIFTYLIENGAHINKASGILDRPVIHAAAARYTKDMRYFDFLVEKGADLNQRDTVGAQLIHRVAETDKDPEGKLIRFLVENGADVNSMANTIGSPLHHAVFSGNINSIKVLIELGADSELENKSRKTPLKSALAAKKGTAHQKFEIARKSAARREIVIQYFEELREKDELQK